MNCQVECFILSENFHAERNLRSFILTPNFEEEDTKA